jgi:tetratricopeptide (TPR) repeat protein
MGALARDGNGWRLTVDVEQITIPDTLHGVIMARVDRLDEDTKQALRLASVIGRSFLHRIVAAMSEAASELDRHLAHLQQLELIREKRRIPELEYIFKHALVQEATYESILVDRRRQLHRRVAECIESLFPERLDEFSALLAYHYARADAWEKAQAYLFKAGDQAARVAADAEALTQYEQAMAAYARAFGDRWDPQERAILERKIGEALFRRGDHHEAIVHYQRALEYYGTPYPKSRWGLRFAIAAEVIRQVGHRLLPGTLWRTRTPADDVMVRERSRLYAASAWVHYFVDQERFVLDTFHQLNLSEQVGLRTGIALGSMAVGVVCDLVALPGIAYRYHQRAIRLGEELQDLFAIGNTHLGRAVHESHAGELRRATTHFDRAAAAFEQIGAIREWGAALSSSGHYVSYYTGDRATMQERARRMIQLGQDAADPQVLGMGLLLLGTAECQIGSLEKSEEHLESARALLSRIPSYVPLVETLAMLGYCLLRQGKFESAVVRLREADRVVAERRLRGAECAHARTFLAEASLLAVERANGREKSRALAEARRACRVAVRYGKIFKAALVHALRLEGTYYWCVGKARAARKRWQQSLSVAELIGARYEAGMTHLEIGRRVADRSSLERAASIFTEVGARYDLAVAQRLLTEKL